MRAPKVNKLVLMCACIIFIYVASGKQFAGRQSWVWIMAFKVFERMDEESYSVFRDKGVLSLSYVPEFLVCREKEEEYFAKILIRGVNENFLPPMVRVFGRTGSGKTAVVRSVLERFSRYRGKDFRWFYVNLKNCRTVFSASNAVLSAICGRRLPVNLGLDRVFAEIWSEVEALKGELDRLFVYLVLDEVDAIFMDKHFDPSDFFYRFLRRQFSQEDPGVKLCLITITNNPHVLEDNLDGRVRSSMGGEMVMFPSYSRKELKEILDRRLSDAFKPDVVEEGVPDYCAELTAEKGGDARKAIDLLRVSGEIANEKESKVTTSCVKKALERVEKDWEEEILNDLPGHSAVILGFIAVLTLEKEKISTRELYDSYRKAPSEWLGPHAPSEKILKKLSERRVSGIVNELETAGLISTWNISRGRKGYRKEIKINMNPQNVLDFYEKRSKRFRFKLEIARASSDFVASFLKRASG